MTYRAPELALQPDNGYGPAVDMWALGCVVAEMMTSSTLFRADSRQELIRKQVRLLGTPSAADAAFIVSEDARLFLETLPPQPRTCFEHVFPHMPLDLLDLLQGLLQFNPAARLTARAAYEHPFLAPAREALERGAPEPELAAWEAMAVDADRHERRRGGAASTDMGGPDWDGRAALRAEVALLQGTIRGGRL